MTNDFLFFYNGKGKGKGKGKGRKVVNNSILGVFHREEKTK